MISETQTRYGVRSWNHGRSLRPWRACQAGMRAAKESAIASLPDRFRRLAARNCLDAAKRVPPVDLQRALDDPRADDGRHPEIGLHLEVVMKQRPLAVLLQLPAFPAVLEIALLRLGDGDDLLHGLQQQVAVALDGAAEEQQAAFHSGVEARPPLLVRRHVVGVDESARDALVVVEVGEHAPDRLAV